MQPPGDNIIPQIEGDVRAAVCTVLDTVFAPQGLFHGQGRVRDFLQEKVGIPFAVDIPRGDLGLLDLFIADLTGVPVVTGGMYSTAILQHIDLSLCFGSAGDAFVLSIHFDEAGSDLHQSVYLRREHVLVIAQADIERLTASPQCEEDLPRFQVTLHGDGMGSLKIVQGQAEGLLEISSLVEIFFYLKGDDLGVRGHPVVY